MWRQQAQRCCGQESELALAHAAGMGPSDPEASPNACQDIPPLFAVSTQIRGTTLRRWVVGST